MVNDSILERIRNLQALANNAGTEAEAALAAQKVAELCQKYNLEIGSVELEKEETEATERYDETAGLCRPHISYLSSTVCEMFGVGHFRDTRHSNRAVVQNGMVIGNERCTRIVFFGLKANTESALLTYQYLKASVESMLMGWIREGNKAGERERRDFRFGCARRIHQKAQELAWQSKAQIEHAALNGNSEPMALVLLGNKLVQQHSQKMHLRIQKQAARVGNRDAYSAGYAAGGRVDIHGARSSRMLA